MSFQSGILLCAGRPRKGRLKTEAQQHCESGDSGCWWEQSVNVQKVQWKHFAFHRMCLSARGFSGCNRRHMSSGCIAQLDDRVRPEVWLQCAASCETCESGPYLWSCARSVTFSESFLACAREWSPEGTQTVGCGQVKAALICLFDVSYVHVDVGDADSNTIVLENKLHTPALVYFT